MRNDIFFTNPDGSPVVAADGTKLIDTRKVIGKGYTRGWFTNCSCRYRVFEGARATKKSYNMIGYEPLFKIVADPNRNILILRQNDVDNYQTTYAQVVRCIGDLGWENRFDIRKSPFEIIYKPTGQKIIFCGLNNPTSLNGITFPVGEFTDIYIDEAFEVTDQDAFDKLDQSCRGVMKPEAVYKFRQVTLCLNPWSQDCWIYREFFKGRLEDDFDVLDNPRVTYVDKFDWGYVGQGGSGLYLHKSTYKVNEFRDKEVWDRSAEEMKTKAPEKYRVRFLGGWGNITGPVYPEWNDSLIHDPIDFVGLDARGMPRMVFSDFAIGLDTGLSNGQGGKRTVKKGEDPTVRIKSATTMQLCAITADRSKMVVVDEYFHSNAKGYNDINTDNKDDLTQPMLVAQCVQYIKKWIHVYGDNKYTRLMKGTIDVFVDGADRGFQDSLRMECRKENLNNVRVFGSGGKTTIQSRVDFEGLMMAYDDFWISKNCPNLIREIKNARRGEKGEAREDTDDHALTAMEYGMAQMLVDLKRYKEFMHD